MNERSKLKIEQRIKRFPNPTPEQLNKLEERIKKHRAKYGKLEHRSIIGNIINYFK